MRPRCSRNVNLALRYRGTDKAATQHSRLAICRVVKHAGLTRRDALLAAGKFDLETVRAAGERRRPRRAGRAHLDEDVERAGRKRGVDRAVADPVEIAQSLPAWCAAPRAARQ